MPLAVQEKAIRICDEAVKKAALDKDIALEVKSLIELDVDLRDPTAGWHCVCGKSFASAITCSTKWYIFFDLLEQHKTFLLFKTESEGKRICTLF